MNLLFTDEETEVQKSQSDLRKDTNNLEDGVADRG